MRFELLTAGNAAEAVSLASCENFALALELYNRTPAAWRIVPSGTRAELDSLGKLESINPRYSGGCFIIDAVGGYTTLGFAVADRKRKAVADWLASEGQPVAPFNGESGTPEAYAAYCAAIEAARRYYEKTGRRCPAELTPQLVGLEGKRVEVLDSYGETRRFTVGKSSGWIPCHLEIESARHSGGPAVSGAPFQSLRVLATA